MSERYERERMKKEGYSYEMIECFCIAVSVFAFFILLIMINDMAIIGEWVLFTLFLTDLIILVIFVILLIIRFKWGETE